MADVSFGNATPTLIYSQYINHTPQLNSKDNKGRLSWRANLKNAAGVIDQVHPTAPNVRHRPRLYVTMKYNMYMKDI